MHDVDLDVAEFPAQAEQAIRETTIGEILRLKALSTPDDMAVADVRLGDDAMGELDRSLTYSELFDEAQTLAHALLTRFRPGERIAIWAPNSVDWIIFEFAAGLAGITYVTVNPSSQARELRFILDQSSACALITVDSYRGNPMWEIARQVAADMPQIRELIRLDDRDAMYRGAERLIDLPDVRPDDPAMIIYTSGTTGVPKGVVLGHKGVTNNARLVFERLDPPAGKPVVTGIPLFHVGGCVDALLGCIQQGCPLLLLSVFDPKLILRVVERHQAGMITGVPTMIFALVEHQEAMRLKVSSLRRVLCGGSSIAPELIRRVKTVLGSDLQNIYGQTEVSGVLTQTHIGDSVEDAAETVGQPLPMTDVSIREPATGAVVRPGEVGEICARGYCVMAGYNQNPEATAAAMHPGGWLRTGDLGTMDRRGYVRVTGRVKEMIIRGGENIFPVEIENVLLEHPSVAEVAVVGIPDERWGEIIACFVRPAAAEALDKEVLIQHCRANISPQKTPARWIAVDDWPLTGSGKIQKFVLRDMLQAGRFD